MCAAPESYVKASYYPITHSIQSDFYPALWTRYQLTCRFLENVAVFINLLWSSSILWYFCAKANNFPGKQALCISNGSATCKSPFYISIKIQITFERLTICEPVIPLECWSWRILILQYCWFLWIVLNSKQTDTVRQAEPINKCF